MATMIPSAISDAYMRTAGERKLYGILKKALPDDCLVRFEMILGLRDSRPDFIVIDPNRGILIIEVKDYSVDKIARASKEQIEVRGMGGNPAPISLTNPQLKCEYYLMDARQQLISMPALHDDRGHPIIAVDYLIAMTNISENDFKKAGLHEVINPEHVLFKETLQEHGGFFLQKYEKQLKGLDQPLSNDQQSDISRALFPDLVLPRVSESGFIPAHKSVVHADKNALSYYALSAEQEDIAKSLGEGPRLLRGIAGTGKTLIMLYRAKLTAANNENARILVLCWNTALANYMRQAYNNIAIAAKNNVIIKHFSDFVQNDLHIRVSNENWDREEFTQLLSAKNIVEAYKFDAIYIDEAQDFRREWIEFIFKRLIKGEPKERNMIVAADDAQLIYPSRGFSWSSLNLDGANFTGRSKILKTIYRNAARVWTFSAFLLEDKAAYVKEGNNKLKFSEKGGYDPKLIDCKDLDAQLDKTIDIVKAVLAGGQAARNILILYHSRRVSSGPTKKPFFLIEELTKKFQNNKIPYDWIAQDPDAKRSFEWETDTVKISTVQSAKGMDSPIVIILGAETFIEEKEYADNQYNEIKLMYVAMTRAREMLIILHSGDGGLVPQLKACEKEYSNYREAIITLEG